MNLNEIREKAKVQFFESAEKIQGTVLFQKLKDRYDNLNPNAQKIAIAALSVSLLGLILMGPLSSYLASSDILGEFEGKRALVKELFSAQKNLSEIVELSVPPNVDAVKAQIEMQLTAAQLLPEQIKSINQAEPASKLIAKEQAQGALEIILSKLNLRQVLDIGTQFTSINPSVKMNDLSIKANIEDSRYFDVVYKLTVLAIPAKPVVAAEPEPATKKAKKEKKSEDKSDE